MKATAQAPSWHIQYLGVQFEEQMEDGPLERLLADMAADEFKNVVVMAGAGISVSANLPDFRSKGGLYDQLRQTTKITAPETIFTRDFLKEQPSLFYSVMQQLKTDHVSPTLTHEFLKRLQDRKILRRIYTQNIDCLEHKVGIDESLLVECHGTTRRARCDQCRTFISKEKYFDQANPPRCSCGSALRPDIVLFGESLPESFQQHERFPKRGSPDHFGHFFESESFRVAAQAHQARLRLVGHQPRVPKELAAAPPGQGLAVTPERHQAAKARLPGW